MMYLSAKSVLAFVGAFLIIGGVCAIPVNDESGRKIYVYPSFRLFSGDNCDFRLCFSSEWWSRALTAMALIDLPVSSFPRNVIYLTHETRQVMNWGKSSKIRISNYLAPFSAMKIKSCFVTDVPSCFLSETISIRDFSMSLLEPSIGVNRRGQYYDW